MPSDDKPLTRAEFIRRDVGKENSLAWSAAAVAVIAVAACLPFALWRGGGFVAMMIAIVLFAYAVRRLGHWLPLTAGMRQRWAHRRYLRRKYTSYDYIGFLWVGIGMTAGCLFSFWRHGAVEPHRLIVPGITMALGGLAAAWWLLVDRKREEADEHGRTRLARPDNPGGTPQA